jgi:hypothetical protein
MKRPWSADARPDTAPIMVALRVATSLAPGDLTTRLAQRSAPRSSVTHTPGDLTLPSRPATY